MTSKETWLKLNKYFWPEEFGVGAYENMDDAFLLKLYRFRVDINTPMILHEGYATSGHSTNSYHYQGRAIDFYFKHTAVSVRRVVVTAAKCGLHGIGIYPHWHTPGFHLDNRPPNRFQVWKRNENGVYIYVMGVVLPETI